jgi:hypothetical protein
VNLQIDASVVHYPAADIVPLMISGEHQAFSSSSLASSSSWLSPSSSASPSSFVFFVFFVVSVLHNATVRFVNQSLSAPDVFLDHGLRDLVESFEPALLHVRERLWHFTESAAEGSVEASEIVVGDVDDLASQSSEHRHSKPPCMSCFFCWSGRQSYVEHIEGRSLQR